jgi:hypothetical protein
MTIKKQDFEIPGDDRPMSVRLAEVVDFLSLHCGDGQFHMIRSVDDALAEVERLRGVVDRLPKTKDGVPVTPGMLVYSVGRFGKNKTTTELLVESSRVNPDENGNLRLIGSPFMAKPHWCYSTREAAEAAKEADHG